MQKDFIDFVKSKASILDIVSSKLKLTRSGRDWFGKCPFHAEKTASFKVDSEAGLYYCFGCGAGGDVIKFVMEFERVGFAEAVELIANRYCIQIPTKDTSTPNPSIPVYDALSTIKDLFFKKLSSPADNESLEAKNYLESRNVHQELIEKFQIGFAPSDPNGNLFTALRKQGFSEQVLLKTGVFAKNKYGTGSHINRFANRIMFPILNASGRCVGFGGRHMVTTNNTASVDATNTAPFAKYINSPESDVFVKSEHLYGYSIAKRSKTRQIILVEGYMDVIAMHSTGFDGAVAPLGTSISEHQINLCWRACDTPIIALDGDGAGLKASYRWVDKILASLTPGKSFKIARLPQNSDPDSLVSSNQTHAITNAIRNAIPLSDWMWNGAFLLYPSQTPEQKAAIIKMLFEKITIIKDQSIQKLYMHELKEKERSLYRRKNTYSTATSIVHTMPTIPVRETMEKILVVTVINHPYIIDMIIENFAAIEFTTPLMQKLRTSILDCYGKYFMVKDIEMYTKSVADIAKSVVDVAEVVELHAKFSRKEATDEEAVAGWLDVYDSHFSESGIQKDLQFASDSLKSTFSNDAWHRLKSLKKESLLTKKKTQEKS